MKNKKEVLIIIPAYNEAKTIVTLLDQLEKPEIASIADVLVMNDASSDATNWVTKARKHTVITHVFNLGYGSGLQLGYKYAIRKGYRYVIQMDADGQHDVKNVLRLYEELKKKDENGNFPDIVLGSRFMEGSASFSVSAAKKAAFVLFRKMIWIGTGKKIMDPTTGLQGLSWRTVLFYSKYNNFDDRYPDANMITVLTSLWVEPYVLYKYRLQKPVFPFFLRYAFKLIVMGIVWGITDLCCSQIEGIVFFQFMIRLGICAVVPNFLLWIIYRKSLDYIELEKVLKVMLKKLKAGRRE